MTLESKYNRLYGFFLGVLEGLLWWECISPDLHDKLVDIKTRLEEGFKL